MDDAKNIHITGIVQGVGFRPFVYNLARKHELGGWVLNAQDGVHIQVQGERSNIEAFLGTLPHLAPVMSRVECMTVETAQPDPLYERKPNGDRLFEIHISDKTAQKSTLVSPDIATCPQCVDELFDPANRRYHYPFINCTQCGPRFTIIDSLPYDRPRTSMADFTMCPECQHEYDDPANRRFHAQPDACFECGPHLFWYEEGRREDAHDLAGSDALVERAASYLSQGRILAIKGLGGYHLACDAGNAQAVATLRRRKRRPSKPFAIMAPNMDAVRSFCSVNAVEAQLLTGPVRPIVLLQKLETTPNQHVVPELRGICDGMREVGVMLPYTPLQHLLLAAYPHLLVMTSGNMSEEPILADDAEAQKYLLPIADALLGNNRPIRSRYDDSVVRVADGEVEFIRRARGYAPVPVKLPRQLSNGKTVLACGPQQKNTFCMTRGEQAFLSQHLGDLENALTYNAWEDTVQLYEELFGLEPKILAADLHPEYLATKWAREHESAALPVEGVQHHHAHIAAVTGEHGYEGRVVGVALDGTGYGTDGHIWGGEILVANWRTFERAAHLRYLPMPGGAAAVRKPCRMALGALLECGLQDHEGAALLKAAMSSDELETIPKMVARDINCPWTSSAGRLLDAVAALTGICTEASYDGEPAIALEAAMTPPETLEDAAAYRFAWHDGIIDPEPALRAALDDLQAGCSPDRVAGRFHAAFARVIVRVTLEIAHQQKLDTVALGGGVFMNRYLRSTIHEGLEKAGLEVLENRNLPANDGCISFGQAVVALARRNT